MAAIAKFSDRERYGQTVSRAGGVSLHVGALVAALLGSALFMALLVAQPASASFAPSADVFVSDRYKASDNYADFPPVAGSAPALTITTKFRTGDELLQKFGATLPLHWRVNGEAMPESCSWEDIKLVNMGNEACPPESHIGSMEAGLLEGAATLPGEVYLKDTPVDKPVEMALVTGLGEQVPPIVSKMYMRPGDYRIQTDLVPCPDPSDDDTCLSDEVLMQMSGMKLHLKQDDERSLFRVPPTANGCEDQATFDWSMSSTGGSVQGQSLVGPLVDCDEVSERFKPRVSVTASTNHAGASPDITMEIERDRGDSAFKWMQVELPDGVLGSPNATPVLCSSEQAKTNSCSIDSKVGNAVMKAKVFESRSYIEVQGGLYAAPTSSCADPAVLACLLYVGKAPDIASGQIIVMPAHLYLRPGLAGVTATFGRDGEAPMPPEFDLRNIKMTFTGSTGRSRNHPLLLLPSTCEQRSFKVTLGSELEQQHTADIPFPMTGCEDLYFQPSTEIKLGCSRPSCLPGVDVSLATPIFGAATTRDVDLDVPRSFSINHKARTTNCPEADAMALSCPASSQIGTVKMSTPLVEGELGGNIYLAAPESGDKETVKRIYTVVTSSLLNMTIEGQLVSRSGGGFTTRLRDLPSVPINFMQLSLFGGQDRGLLQTPAACGRHVFSARATSHSGKAIALDYPIYIRGRECGPAMSAQVGGAGGGKSDLALTVRPNAGLPIEDFRVQLGPKRGGGGIASGKVGTVALTRLSGSSVTAKLVNKGGQLRVKGAGPTVKALSKSGLQLRRGRLNVTGLPNVATKEIKVILSRAKTGLPEGSKRCKRRTVQGTFFDFEGQSYTTSAQVRCTTR